MSGEVCQDKTRRYGTQSKKEHVKNKNPERFTTVNVEDGIHSFVGSERVLCWAMKDELSSHVDNDIVRQGFHRPPVCSW